LVGSGNGLGYGIVQGSNDTDRIMGGKWARWVGHYNFLKTLTILWMEKGWRRIVEGSKGINFKYFVEKGMENVWKHISNQN